MVGELFTACIRCGIYGCPAFIDHDDLNLTFKRKALNENFSFPSGGTVSNGDGIHGKPFAEGLYFLSGLLGF